MSIVFNGPVQVYLQGKDALFPVDASNDQISYWIGSQNSKLFLKDHRYLPIRAANRVLAGEDGSEFADIFNQPAIAKVNLEDDAVNIELHEIANAGNYPILWLGVLEKNLMPNYSVEWEYLRPLNSHSTAISILIKE